MKKYILFLLLSFYFVVTPCYGQNNTSIEFIEKLDPLLNLFLDNRAQAKAANVIVLMDYINLSNNPFFGDLVVINEFLQMQSQTVWEEIKYYLNHNFPNSYYEVQPTQLYSLNQSFSAVVSPMGLRYLLETPYISKIYFDDFVQDLNEGIEPGEDLLPLKLPNHFSEIGMNKVLDRFPGIDGSGVTIGLIDTGIDTSHESLKNKVEIFFNANSREISIPEDSGTHGSFVSGLIVGGTLENPMGIAPLSKLVVGAYSGQEGEFSAILNAMEFMINPDGFLETSFDIPKIINSSWSTQNAHLDGFDDQEIFYRALDVWESMDILPVFSSGNSGKNGVTAPKEHPATLAVGFLNKEGMIHRRSSRGPGVFKNQLTFKPELVAPGENISSASFCNCDGLCSCTKTGSSFSAAMVSGAASLVSQMNPNLSSNDIKNVLIDSAFSFSEDGFASNIKRWNKNFGYGKLDVFNALEMVHQFTLSAFNIDIQKKLLSPLNNFIFSKQIYSSNYRYTFQKKKRFIVNKNSFKHFNSTCEVGAELNCY